MSPLLGGRGRRRQGPPLLARKGQAPAAERSEDSRVRIPLKLSGHQLSSL